MKFKMKYIVIFGVLLMAFSCKNDSKESIATTAVTETVVEGKPNTIPPLGEDIFNKMYDECTFIDYLWHELPFSVSQGEKPAVQANVSFISKSGMSVIPTNCKSIGRKSYQINGDIYLDADVYFGEGCNFYIFLKDEKPIYLNKMTDQGIEFYNRLIQSALDQGKKLQNG